MNVNHIYQSGLPSEIQRKVILSQSKIILRQRKSILRKNKTIWIQNKTLSKSCQYVSDNRNDRTTGYTGRLLLGALVEMSNGNTIVIVAHREDYCHELLIRCIQISEIAFGDIQPFSSNALSLWFDKNSKIIFTTPQRLNETKHGLQTPIVIYDNSVTENNHD